MSFLAIFRLNKTECRQVLFCVVTYLLGQQWVLVPTWLIIYGSRNDKLAVSCKSCKVSRGHPRILTGWLDSLATGHGGSRSCGYDTRGCRCSSTGCAQLNLQTQIKDTCSCNCCMMQWKIMVEKIIQHNEGHYIVSQKLPWYILHLWQKP